MQNEDWVLSSITPNEMLVSMILKIHVVLGIYWQKWNQKIFTVMFSLSVLVTKNCCVLC